MLVSAASVADVWSYAASVLLGLAFVVVVVSGALLAFRHREQSNPLLAVLVGFLAAGSVSALVAALV